MVITALGADIRSVKAVLDPIRLSGVSE
jgi:hypothetical protein